jgi:hypothetical protein
MGRSAAETAAERPTEEVAAFHGMALETADDLLDTSASV